MVLKILLSSDPALQKILELIAFLLSAYLAICLHEYAHGFAAYKLGDPTAKVNGRLTMNPLAHFDPLGLVMFLFVGFGYARPVPIDPYNFRNVRKGVLITAFAGVIANLMLVIAGFAMMVGFGYLYLPYNGGNTALSALLFFLFYFSLYLTLINAVLIAFNLLPIFPLDGFRVVEALSKTPNGYIRFMRRFGSYILIGIVALGFLFERVGIPQANVFGLYLDAVQDGILLLFNKIMGGLFG